jgi:hypothetical protein
MGAAGTEHAKLVELAVAWLKRGVPYNEEEPPWKRKCTLVLGEIVTAAFENPDAIGFDSGFSIVVECKTSRADFFADRKKSHMFDATRGMGRMRWYLVPAGLVKPEETPDWCGLAYAKGRGVEVVKYAPIREIDSLAALNECIVLQSCVRRFQLDVPFSVRTIRDGRGREEANRELLTRA